MIKVRVLIQRGETGLRTIGSEFETHEEKAKQWVDKGWVEYVDNEDENERDVLDIAREFIEGINKENNVD